MTSGCENRGWEVASWHLVRHRAAAVLWRGSRMDSLAQSQRGSKLVGAAAPKTPGTYGEELNCHSLAVQAGEVGQLSSEALAAALVPWQALFPPSSRLAKPEQPDELG